MSCVHTKKRIKATREAAATLDEYMVEYATYLQVLLY